MLITISRCILSAELKIKAAAINQLVISYEINQHFIDNRLIIPKFSDSSFLNENIVLSLELRKKQDIWGRDLEPWEPLMDIFWHFID